MPKNYRGVDPELDKYVEEAKAHFMERFVKVRDERGLTQEQFAEKLGCSAQSISNWGRREPQISLETAIRISKILNCDLDFLVGSFDEQTHDIRDVSEFTGLSEKAIRKIAPPGLHPNASCPTAITLNDLIEADGFKDFIDAFMAFTVMADKEKTWVKPEMPPYPTDKTGAIIIDGTWKAPDGACIVIGENSVKIPLDDAVPYFIQEVARKASRLCEGICEKDDEICMKNAKQKKRIDSKKNRRHE